MPISDLPPELWENDLVQQSPASPGAEHWLQNGLSSLPFAGSYTVPLTASYIVPLTASIVHTPLCAPAWQSMLRNHPDKHLVQFMLNGICSGFHIGFTKPLSSLKAATSNLERAQEHPSIVTEYLSTEVSLGRVAGPFPL